MTTRERRHLRWLTIIIDVIRVREADILDPDRRRDLCALVAAKVEDYRTDWTAQTRGRNLSGLTWRGTVELDLRREIVPGSHTEATLASLHVDKRPLEPSERLLVVHVHIVLDGAERAADDDHDGERWANHVRSILRATWMGPWRTLLKGLRQDQSVREAVSNLYGYCHKNRLQYSTGGLGDQPTKFHDHYEWSWSRFIVQAYTGFDIELRSRR